MHSTAVDETPAEVLIAFAIDIRKQILMLFISQVITFGVLISSISILFMETPAMGFLISSENKSRIYPIGLLFTIVAEIFIFIEMTGTVNVLYFASSMRAYAEKTWKKQ